MKYSLFIVATCLRRSEATRHPGVPRSSSRPSLLSDVPCWSDQVAQLHSSCELDCVKTQATEEEDKRAAKYTC
jgi:hypothetical protein